MPENINSLVLLALSWLAYFIIHSVFASLWLKQRIANVLPFFVAWYRVCFNLLAIGLILPPLWMMHAFAGQMLWQWQGVWSNIANFLALLSVLGFLWSLHFYDGMDFLGLRQLKSGKTAVNDTEKLCISPLHRFVRHPWYFFALVIIWTRDMDLAFLVSAICMTLYFMIGSWLEEKKLVVFHGESYRRYKRYVPGVFPLPWRFLDKVKLEEIETMHYIKCAGKQGNC